MSRSLHASHERQVAVQIGTAHAQQSLAAIPVQARHVCLHIRHDRRMYKCCGGPRWRSRRSGHAQVCICAVDGFGGCLGLCVRASFDSL